MSAKCSLFLDDKNWFHLYYDCVQRAFFLDDINGNIQEVSIELLCELQDRLEQYLPEDKK